MGTLPLIAMQQINQPGGPDVWFTVFCGVYIVVMVPFLVWTVIDLWRNGW
jgi:hypothetical protein